MSFTSDRVVLVLEELVSHEPQRHGRLTDVHVAEQNKLELYLARHRGARRAACPQPCTRPAAEKSETRPAVPSALVLSAQAGSSAAAAGWCSRSLARQKT